MPLALLAALILGQTANPAVVPAPVANNAWWMNRHEAMNRRVKQGGVALVFIGDSITHAFAGEPNTGDGFADRGKDTWDLFYGDRRAVNLGISGDRTQHVLWRLDHGNLEGIRPKVAVIMIGTNNVGVNRADEIAEGVQAVCLKVREKSPTTRVLLLAVFPRGAAASPERAKLADVNRMLAAWAPKHRVVFLDIGRPFLDAQGEIPDEVMPDKLHPMALGYRIWAMAMEPTLAKMLGLRPKSTADPTNRAVVPVTQQRDSYNWMERHQAVLARVRSGPLGVAMIGDSITHMWGGEPAAPDRAWGKEVWDRFLGPWKPANLGFGWDRTENVLWRLEQGELDGADPRGVVVLIGTNNLDLNTAEEIRDGIGAVVRTIRAKAPATKVLVLGLLPRGPKADDPMRLKAEAVNRLLPAATRAWGVEYLDLRDRFLEPDGTISREVMPDFLHPSNEGYRRFADGLRPRLVRMLGLPSG